MCIYAVRHIIKLVQWGGRDRTDRVTVSVIHDKVGIGMHRDLEEQTIDGHHLHHL